MVVDEGICSGTTGHGICVEGRRGGGGHAEAPLVGEHLAEAFSLLGGEVGVEDDDFTDISVPSGYRAQDIRLPHPRLRSTWGWVCCSGHACTIYKFIDIGAIAGTDI